jgi:hypothetical protein
VTERASAIAPLTVRPADTHFRFGEPISRKAGSVARISGPPQRPQRDLAAQGALDPLHSGTTVSMRNQKMDASLMVAPAQDHVLRRIKVVPDQFSPCLQPTNCS